MRRLIAIFLFFLTIPVLASTYFGFKLEYGDKFYYKLFAEKEVISYVLPKLDSRIVVGVELYSRESLSPYITVYTGYEIDLDRLWIQLRVREETDINFHPRFNIALLGGFRLP